jgi:hypothetical protein
LSASNAAMSPDNAALPGSKEPLSASNTAELALDLPKLTATAAPPGC